MRRKGSVNDWHEFLPVLHAFSKGSISFARLAELGREWLQGMPAADLRTHLPTSEATRVAAYARKHPGAYVKEIAEAVGLTQTRVAQLLGRLRTRHEIRTTKVGFRVRVWPRGVKGAA